MDDTTPPVTKIYFVDMKLLTDNSGEKNNKTGGAGDAALTLFAHAPGYYGIFGGDFARRSFARLTIA